ncbi:MAG: hypothetical protein QOD63_77 [Actinomycetota bacterium]|nr:hypothetical protein [Actinomycetota bacterium]
MVRRMLAAYGRNVGDGDPADLAELLALDEQLHEIIAATVRHMRAEQEWTWERIGEAAGTSRQGAQQRWGRKLPGPAAGAP